MISIDLIFLVILINAAAGSVYMRLWTKCSRRLEKTCKYSRIYRSLRMGILFFTLPGIFTVFAGSGIRAVGGMSVSALAPAWRAAVILVFAGAVFWLAGAVWHTCRYLREVHAFCRICEFNTEIKNEQIREYFAGICQRQHIYKGVTVYANSRIQVPVIFGVFKRTILIPDHCSRPEELQIILEHEMIHAKHNDLLLERIAAILHLILWFVPGPEQLLYEMEAWSETACDITVCGSENSVWSKKQYFSLLIQWAQDVRTAEVGTAMALSGEPSSIRTRILRVKQYEQSAQTASAKDFQSGVRITGLMLCLALCMGFGLQKLGQDVAAQFATGYLLNQNGSSGSLWNGGVKLRGSSVVRGGQSRIRLMYLKEGEHIQIHYGAEHCEQPETAVPEKNIFGMIGISGIMDEEEKQSPGCLGQNYMGYTADDGGWYVFKLENRLEDTDVNVDYIVIKK